MFEFKTIQILKPNTEILEVIKDYKYKVKNGKVKNLLHTNLQVIEPTEYLIKYPISITILEYKVNEISSKPFYIKEHKQKYNLKEIKQILNKFKM
jgi:hypothetical protein